MPTVELNLKQITAAVRQLNRDEFLEFLRELSRQSRSEFARLSEKELRMIVNTTLGRRQQKRLSVLMSANSDGTLSASEKDELNQLVAEVQRVTLERTEAMYELYRRGIDVRPKVAVQRAKKR